MRDNKSQICWSLEFAKLTMVKQYILGKEIFAKEIASTKTFGRIVRIYNLF